MNKIKVLLVDDHGLMREGISSMIDSFEDIQIVGSVSSGEEAVNEVREKNPDVVLMDIMMKGMSGLEATKWIKEQNPEVKILLLSMEVNKDLIETGISLGISGYMLKSSSRDVLIEGIRKVNNGEKYFTEEITDTIFQKFYEKSAKIKKEVITTEPEILSKRETEILKNIADGLSNKEVAEKLFISPKTVDAHIYNIQTKLGLKSKVELVRYAIKNEITDIE